jgi:hypothetical protein
VSWKVQVGCRNILKIWMLAPLMWCIWRERNTRSFEDQETSVVELKKIMFNSLYTWIAMHNSSTFSDFLWTSVLPFFFFFFPNMRFLLCTSYILGLCSSVLL